MKKRIVYLMAFAMLLTLAACVPGNKGARGQGNASEGYESNVQNADNTQTDADKQPSGEGETGSPKDNSSLGGLASLMDGDGPWFNEDASGCDLFARHGLTDVVPENCLYIRRWMEDDWDDLYVRTEYTFEIPGEPAEEERQAYFNRILDQIRAAADDGKAYAWEFISMDPDTYEVTANWVDKENYAEPVQRWDSMACTYYYDGRLWDVMVSDDDFDDYYVYEINISSNITTDKP